MGDTWTTDLRHYLEDGQLGRELPVPALNIALHLGSIVAWVTSRGTKGVQRTNVVCRRSPGRRRCTTEIEAGFEEAGTQIRWRCSSCGDNGYIHGWQGTQWDRRQPGAANDDPVVLRIVGDQTRGRQKIHEDDAVPVKLTARNRELLNDLVIEASYVERLRPIKNTTEFVGEFTLDELDDIQGYVAAEANHTENSRFQDELDDLFGRLMSVSRSYDDGNWNDSDV